MRTKLFSKNLSTEENPSEQKPMFIITYELKKNQGKPHNGQDYGKIEEAIKTIDSNAKKLFRTVWQIRTTKTLEDIEKKVSKALDENDSYIIVEVHTTKTTDGKRVEHIKQKFSNSTKDKEQDEITR
jgi:hypothetical protein